MWSVVYIGLLPLLDSIGHDMSGVNLFVSPSNCPELVNAQIPSPQPDSAYIYNSAQSVGNLY